MLQRCTPILTMLTAVILIAAENHSTALLQNDLTVHEWGTFTSVAGEDGLAVDWDSLACPNDLPGFVNDFGYRGFKWKLRGTVRMETPVMYFYSPRELTANVTVRFPHGLITEWYPQARNAIYQGDAGNTSQLPENLNGIDTSMGTLTGSIEWRDIKVQPGTDPALPVESRPGRYYAARGTDAAPLNVGGQREKFLFYRGVSRSPVPLSARVASDGKIVIGNLGHEPVPGVILFENRGGRLGYRNVGAVRDTASLDPPSLDSSFPQLQRDLETELTAQGLFPKDAHAMVETWRDSWFEEGSRLLYIVPARAVDSMLPVQIEPVPAQTVRVFVGRIEVITPETRRSVREAIAKNDRAVMERFGRFLQPILERMEVPRSVVASFWPVRCQ
ncbi:MAG: hypothetical protein JWO80_3124 [Bryobacterales bacterium]|nr:hypothetical protein [Bryobacterales bacterium]